MLLSSALVVKFREILSEILIMTRKSNSNPSVKSLREENEALKKEIESLKSEFKLISSALKSHESSHGGHKPHPDTESAQNMAALHVEQRDLLTSQEMNTTILMQTVKTLNN